MLCWKNKKDVILICATHSTKIVDVNDDRRIEEYVVHLC